MQYIIHTFITIGYYLILVVSLNVTLGFTGVINLGHVAFFGIGAYTTAILTKQGAPFLVSFLSAGVVAALSGYLLTRLTQRLKGDYVALATLGFSFVVYTLLLNWRSLTRGAFGIPGIEKPNLFGWMIATNGAYLVFVWCVAVTTVYVLWRLTRSRYGTVLQALRDDALGLAALGKNIFRLRYQAMMISAGFAGIAGALFAHYITYIHPSNFFLSDIILLLSIVIVGGLASIKGSVIATFLLIFLTESLRFVSLPAAVVGPARLMIYALLLLVILMYRPRGLFGKVDLE